MWPLLDYDHCDTSDGHPQTLICQSIRTEGGRPDPEVWQKKRKKYSRRTAILEEALHELYLTPCDGCSLSTLAFEDDLTLQRENDGNEFLSFTKGPTKTRQGRLSVKTRLVTLKMFAKGNEERCPVMLFKRLQRASFKRLTQENPSRKEHHKHIHEQHERELSAKGSVSRDEFDLP